MSLRIEPSGLGNGRTEKWLKMDKPGILFWLLLFLDACLDQPWSALEGYHRLGKPKAKKAYNPHTGAPRCSSPNMHASVSIYRRICRRINSIRVQDRAPYQVPVARRAPT